MNVNVRMMTEEELKEVFSADKEYGLLHNKGNKNKRNRTGNVIELKRVK